MLNEQNEFATPNGPLQAGARTFIDLANGKRTLGVWLRITATATVTVANLTALRNRGSLLSQFSYAGINDNGRDVVNLDMRSLGVIGNIYAGQPFVSQRLGVAQAVYPLEEIVYLPLANPLAISPSETAFQERNPATRLRVFVTWMPNNAAIANVGAGTLVITTPVVEVLQNYDDDRGIVLPKLSPFWREILVPIDNANQALRSLLDSSLWLRGILIQEDTNVGEVNDILNSFRFLGDQRTYYGPQQIPVDVVKAFEQPQFGGDLALPDGYTYLYFQRGGRLSNLINQSRNANLRFESDVTPSVAAGATNSNLRLSVMECEWIRGLNEPLEKWNFES